MDFGRNLLWASGDAGREDMFALCYCSVTFIDKTHCCCHERGKSRLDLCSLFIIFQSSPTASGAVVFHVRDFKPTGQRDASLCLPIVRSRQQKSCSLHDTPTS
ncbi:unnamed protein product [Pylaiella littoralis]